jgi:hypothetical protein
MQIPKHQVAETAEDIGVENITKTPTGDAFVKPHLEKVGGLNYPRLSMFALKRSSVVGSDHEGCYFCTQSRSVISTFVEGAGT